MQSWTKTREAMDRLLKGLYQSQPNPVRDGTGSSGTEALVAPCAIDLQEQEVVGGELAGIDVVKV